jgi:hypothetical protein
VIKGILALADTSAFASGVAGVEEEREVPDDCRRKPQPSGVKDAIRAKAGA